MCKLTWKEIKDSEKKDFLTEKEYKIYSEALADFNERKSNTHERDLSSYFEGGIGLSAMHFARQWADAKTQPNLYKSVYSIVTNAHEEYIGIK